MKTVILGSNGQLGSDLVKEFTNARVVVHPMTHNDVNVENYESVRGALIAVKPDVVLNTTAFHVVPKCEEEPLRAFQVNAMGALNVARVCDELKAVNLYYSTDYVFDGTKKAPYIEADTPNPLNVYSSTKLLGEYYTLNYSQKPFVIRVSGIYGKVPCRAKGGNFITAMLKAAREKPEVKVVQDEILTPTPTKEIAKRTLAIVHSGAYGLFHLTSEGKCSWYAFARVIFETLRLRTPLVPCNVLDFPMTVKRPIYSVLENDKAKRLAINDMPYWKDSLLEFLRENYV